MTTLTEKIKPLLKEKGIRFEDFAKSVGISRNQLYIVGKQSVVDGSFLNKVADALEIDRKFFDDLRHPSVHQSNLQSQSAVKNQGMVSQSIVAESAIEDLKTLYERMLKDKDEEIRFLKQMLKDNK